MGSREFNRISKIASALPEVNQRLSHGSPCFFLRNKRPVCYYHEANFHFEGSRPAVWCPAPPGDQESLVASDPDRFFAPTPSSSGVFSTWIGVYLDSTPTSALDWAVIQAVIEDAYRLIAPKKLSAKLDPKPNDRRC